MLSRDGSAAHPWLSNEALLRGPHCARSLADLVHFLCILHGRYPGVVDHAAARTIEEAPRLWLARAAGQFAAERGGLARLAAAAGPVPSTPGAADSDSAVRAQRHAIDMLAQSERSGCAFGAAIAVSVEWTAIRSTLEAAADRFGVTLAPYAQPEIAEIEALCDGFAASLARQRALLFGAEQILVQHKGLFDLLECRHQARAAP
jgi:hypothetical protein